MATPQQGNPEFSHFVNYMGVKLTEHNEQIYAELYRNFAGWSSPPNQDYSFAEKFIEWKRFYDEYKETQEQVINTNLFSTPPTDPRVLKTTNVQLPHDLRQLNTNTFQHFILQNDPQTSQSPHKHIHSPVRSDPQNLSILDQTSQSPRKHIHSPVRSDPQNLSIMDDPNILTEIAKQNIEIIEEVLQQSEIPHSSIETPQYSNVENSSQGKNIAQMKAIYNSEKKPASRKRKRKEPQDNVEKTTVIIGPGRPSKNDGLLRDAQNEDGDNNDDDSIYAFRDVLLLTGNGTIRKKAKLLTKQSDRDMRCFAIKHFASLEYIADKKRKSFAIIKKERQKLKTLNYLELNTINDMKEINNM